MKMIKDHWHLITSLVFIVFLFTTVQVKQDAIAARVDKLEQIQKDIQDIKIKVERIDERTENLKQRK
ncbi:MAG TPA: hypothetical protein V6C58_24700 [Allocoleopsis sp.]